MCQLFCLFLQYCFPKLPSLIYYFLKYCFYFIDSVVLFFVGFIEASLILWLLCCIFLSILVYSAIKYGYPKAILIDVYRNYLADLKRSMIGPEYLHTVVLNIMFNNRWILISLNDSAKAQWNLRRLN